MTGKTTLAVLLGASLGLMGSALAQPGQGQQRGQEAHPHRGTPVAQLLRQLDLTDEQKAIATEQRDALKAERTDQRSERSSVGKDMMAEFASGDPSVKALHKLIDESAKMHTKAKHDALDRMMEIVNSLDDAQLTKLAELAQQRLDTVSQRPGR